MFIVVDTLGIHTKVSSAFSRRHTESSPCRYYATPTALHMSQRADSSGTQSQMGKAGKKGGPHLQQKTGNKTESHSALQCEQEKVIFQKPLFPQTLPLAMTYLTSITYYVRKKGLQRETDSSVMYACKLHTFDLHK